MSTIRGRPHVTWNGANSSRRKCSRASNHGAWLTRSAYVMSLSCCIHMYVGRSDQVNTLGVFVCMELKMVPRVACSGNSRRRYPWIVPLKSSAATTWNEKMSRPFQWLVNCEIYLRHLSKCLTTSLPPTGHIRKFWASENLASEGLELPLSPTTTKKWAIFVPELCWSQRSSCTSHRHGGCVV